MILPGAKRYWEREEAIRELSETWGSGGADLVLLAIRRMFLELPAGQRRSVLDVGCGPGRVLSMLSDLDFIYYVGIDQSQEMIDEFLNTDDQRVSGQVLEMSDLPKIHPDVVLCIDVLQHQTDPVGDLNRLLASGQYKHLIATLLVGSEHKQHDLPDGPGSIVVARPELNFLYEPILTTRIGETWIVRFDHVDLPETLAPQLPF